MLYLSHYCSALCNQFCMQRPMHPFGCAWDPREFCLKFLPQSCKLLLPGQTNCMDQFTTNYGGRSYKIKATKMRLPKENYRGGYLHDRFNPRPSSRVLSVSTGDSIHFICLIFIFRTTVPVVTSPRRIVGFIRSCIFESRRRFIHMNILRNLLMGEIIK